MCAEKQEDNAKTDSEAITTSNGNKNCPLCTKLIPQKAIVCPYCRHVIGKWGEQLHMFIAFGIIPATAIAVVGLFVGFYFNKWISPIPIFSPNSPPTLQAQEGKLIYAYKIEKGPRVSTGFLGLGSGTNIYYVILGITNNGKYKLKNIRVNLDVSNTIISHGLPYQYKLFDDKDQPIKDLEKYFADKNKVIFTIPFILPEQNISMWFAVQGEVKVNDISIYSEEVKGIPGNFGN